VKHLQRTPARLIEGRPIVAGFLKALNKLKPSLDRLLADLGSIRRARPTKRKEQPV
jgi:hypothetical protein